GLEEVALQQPPVSGTDTSQKTDVNSAYVTLRRKGGGEALGTYLVSLWYCGSIYQMLPERLQDVRLAGKTYVLSLRPKRIYKPYTIHLNQFTHGKYQGTEIAKDFRSEIRLLDPGENEDREVEIYMNNPLRYRGETFYQSGFLNGDRGTIL